MTKANPFRGMNPFLESFWPDVHTSLLVYIADVIAEQLPSGLKARCHENIPSEVIVADSWRRGVTPGWQSAEEVDELTERWVKILDSHGKVITIIELLSPLNKGAGRSVYQAKYQSYVESGVNVVEIDLLRGGDHAVAMPYSLRDQKVPYAVCVTRATNPAQKDYYQTRLTATLPNVRIPLRIEDQDAVLQLQPLVDRCYRMGGYWNESHAKLPNPPLDEEDSAWVQQQLKEAGLR